MYFKEYSIRFLDLIFVYRVDCFFPLTRITCQERSFYVYACVNKFDCIMVRFAFLYYS